MLIYLYKKKKKQLNKRTYFKNIIHLIKKKIN